MKRASLTAAMALATYLLFGWNSVLAGESPNPQRSLPLSTQQLFFRGLAPAMVVRVDEIPEVARNNGWRQEDFEVIVNQKLRRAGIEVVTKDNPNWIEFPVLRLSVEVIEMEGGNYWYTLRLKLLWNIAIRFSRDVPLYDTKWSAHYPGVVGVKDARLFTNKLVDAFLIAFFKEKPKTP